MILQEIVMSDFQYKEHAQGITQGIKIKNIKKKQRGIKIPTIKV